MSTNDDATGFEQDDRQPARGNWLELGIWVMMAVGLLAAVLVTHLSPKH
ncbi:MAG TPA: hypothetical protein VF796_22150 [Humisphaera sp.]